MIRPAIECWERIANPEKGIKTIKDYKNVLMCCLIENFSNKHVVNRLMHYYFDLHWMSKNNVYHNSDAKDLFFFPPIPKRRKILRID